MGFQNFVKILVIYSLSVHLSLAKTLYDILQVDAKASADEIKQSYRNLAKQLHPDKNKDDSSAHDKFIELSKAYEILSDEENRRNYDSNLRYGFESPEDLDSASGFPGSRTNDGADRQMQREEFIVFQTPRGPVYVKIHGNDPFAGGGPGDFQPLQMFQAEFRAEDFFGNFNPFGAAPPPEPLWYEILQIFLANGSLMLVLLGVTYCYYNYSFNDFFGDFTRKPKRRKTPLGRKKMKTSSASSAAAGESDSSSPQQTQTGNSQNGTAEDEEDEEDEEESLPDFTGDVSGEYATTVVIALTEQAEAELIAIRDNYKKDRVHFARYFSTSQGVNDDDDNEVDRIQIIALGKQGERWTSLSWNKGTVLTKTNSLNEGLVDAWVLKLLIGELKWTSAIDQQIPVALPALKKADK